MQSVITSLQVFSLELQQQSQFNKEKGIIDSS